MLWVHCRQLYNSGRSPHNGNLTIRNAFAPCLACPLCTSGRSPNGGKTRHGGLVNACGSDSGDGCERSKQSMARGCIVPRLAPHHGHTSCGRLRRSRSLQMHCTHRTKIAQTSVTMEPPPSWRRELVGILPHATIPIIVASPALGVPSFRVVRPVEDLAASWASLHPCRLVGGWLQDCCSCGLRREKLFWPNCCDVTCGHAFLVCRWLWWTHLRNSAGDPLVLVSWCHGFSDCRLIAGNTDVDDRRRHAPPLPSTRGAGQEVFMKRACGFRHVLVLLWRHARGVPPQFWMECVRLHPFHQIPCGLRIASVPDAMVVSLSPARPVMQWASCFPVFPRGAHVFTVPLPFCDVDLVSSRHPWQCAT